MSREDNHRFQSKTAQEIEVYETKPHDFNPTIEVVANYVNVSEKILLLKLAPNKSEAGHWGVPAGKLEKQESPLEGAKRELFEETGIDLPFNNIISSIGQLYIRKPEFDYIYHLFSVRLDKLPDVRLSKEHEDHKWVSRQEAEELPLMLGAHHALDAYYKHIKKRRSGVNVNAYLVLRRSEEVLLLLRKNTGYFDNQYGLVAGHVEDGESATAAIIREAYEEANIQLNPEAVRVVHVMHRKSDRPNVDVFFECNSWSGTLMNREPEKCGGLEYHPLKKLPKNTIEYIRRVLEAISKGEIYSECGWK